MASAANPLGWQQQPDHLSTNASQPGWERARPAATPNYAPPPHREEWSQGPSAGYGRPGPGHGMPDTSQPVLRPEFHYQPDFRAAPVPIGLSHTFDGGFRPNFPVRPRPRSPRPRFGAARLWDTPALCLPPPLLRAIIAPFERRWAFCPGEACPSFLCQDGARASLAASAAFRVHPDGLAARVFVHNLHSRTVSGRFRPPLFSDELSLRAAAAPQRTVGASRPAGRLLPTSL